MVRLVRDTIDEILDKPVDLLFTPTKHSCEWRHGHAVEGVSRFIASAIREKSLEIVADSLDPCSPVCSREYQLSAWRTLDLRHDTFHPGFGVSKAVCPFRDWQRYCDASDVFEPGPVQYCWQMMRILDWLVDGGLKHILPPSMYRCCRW